MNAARNEAAIADTHQNQEASTLPQEPSRFAQLMKSFFAQAFKERDRKRRRERDKYYGF